MPAAAVEAMELAPAPQAAPQTAELTARQAAEF
jgi:hypothetical protein